MKKGYLNNKLRDQIRKKIEAHVTTTINNSAGGQERSNLLSNIEYKLRLFFSQNVPKEDRKILKKHGVLSSIESLYFELSDKNELKDPWSTSRSSVFKIEFENPIKVPKRANLNLFVINIINQEDYILDPCIALYKINDALNCEIKEIVTSYYRMLQRHRTIKTLLRAFPSISKFIPEEEEKEMKVDPTREEQIIKEFEKEGSTPKNVCN